MLGFILGFCRPFQIDDINHSLHIRLLSLFLLESGPHTECMTPILPQGYELNLLPVKHSKVRLQFKMMLPGEGFPSSSRDIIRSDLSKACFPYSEPNHTQGPPRANPCS